MQSVQNAAAHLLSNSRKRGHIALILKTLHYLVVGFRIRFKILILTFKALSGKCGYTCNKNRGLCLFSWAGKNKNKLISEQNIAYYDASTDNILPGRETKFHGSVVNHQIDNQEPF